MPDSVQANPSVDRGIHIRAILDDTVSIIIILLPMIFDRFRYVDTSQICHTMWQVSMSSLMPISPAIQSRYEISHFRITQCSYPFVVPQFLLLNISWRISFVHLIPIGRAGAAGNKFRTTLALPVAAVMNCADNSGAKNLYVVSVCGIGGRLNRLPAAAIGDMIMASVKKGKPELRKKITPAVVVRQRRAWRRENGTFIYFEDNAGVIVNPKGEMKGSAVTGPIAKECADLWPRIAAAAGSIM